MLAACGPPEPLDARIERERLMREKAALAARLARNDEPEHETGAVVSVHSALVREILEVALPVEATVDRFKVTATSAVVDFTSGLALVRLGGTVQWADREDVSADLEILGALQILGISETTGTLLSRVEVLGYETRDMQLGSLAPPVERLLDGLAARPVAELNQLLSHVEIPMRLVQAVSLPAIQEEEITIPGAELPLRIGVHDVRVRGDRVWVFLDVEVVEVVGLGAGCCAAQP